MRSATFVLATAVPRGLAWLSLLGIPAGVAYMLTAAVAVSGPTAAEACGVRGAQMPYVVEGSSMHAAPDGKWCTGPATLSPDAPPAEIAAAAAQAMASLRPMLAKRGFEMDVVAGSMIAAAPGQTAPWPEARAVDYVVDDDMDAMIGPVQIDAWLVFTEAGRWWLWPYGVAAPADRRAQASEAQAMRAAGPEGRGLD